MLENKLTDVSSHFEFGKNWAEYSSKIDENKIKFAHEEMVRLLGTDDLTNKTFLDIGCGSGIHSLVAQKMGAKVLATDIDENSVKTTKNIIEKYGDKSSFSCEVKSVFDFNPIKDGTFDIVYSWGVLHHTGNMKKGFEKASSLVKENGLLAIAVYRKTPLCVLWKVEKKIYSKSPAIIQKLIALIYKIFFVLGLFATKRNPKKYIENYFTKTF